MGESQTFARRRFWKIAAVAEADEAFAVTLDGRVPKTPSGQPLHLPMRSLAEAIAEEWEAQSETIDPFSMPLTRLANVAIDRTPLVREAMAEEVVRYCETDLLCHLADTPQELIDRQNVGWAPVRDWAAGTLGIRLNAVAGVIAAEQPETSLHAARRHAAKLDDFRLTGLAWAVPLFGSALLGLVVEQGELQSEAAFDLSRIDELWQIEQWGEDAEAAEVAARRAEDARALGRWFAALER
jgi:chaperone required for assembly of F1-ATPase